MTDKEILEMHPYAIWQNKRDGSWHTTFPDETKAKKTRQIKRKTREELDRSIIEFHRERINNSEVDPYESTQQILKKEQLTKDFSHYKEIKVWNIREGAYLISPIGNVYSTIAKKWRELQINDKTKTYPGQYYVALETTSGEIKRFSVARLVMATYVGLPPEDMKDPTVDHIDQMPLNNYYKNLRWVERGINSSTRKNRGIGEMNSNAKLSANDVAHICNLLVKKLKTVSQIAAMYKVSEMTIQKIVDKENWQFISQWFEFD